MKKDYIYIIINEEEEIIGANKTVEGVAKKIKEYIEGDFSDVEIYLDKLIEILNKNACGYIFYGDELIKGVHYQTYIKYPIEEQTLLNLKVVKVLLEK